MAIVVIKVPVVAMSARGVAVGAGVAAAGSTAKAVTACDGQ